MSGQSEFANESQQLQEPNRKTLRQQDELGKDKVLRVEDWAAKVLAEQDGLTPMERQQAQTLTNAIFEGNIDVLELYVHSNRNELAGASDKHPTSPYRIVKAVGQVGREIKRLPGSLDAYKIDMTPSVVHTQREHTLMKLWTDDSRFNDLYYCFYPNIKPVVFDIYSRDGGIRHWDTQVRYPNFRPETLFKTYADRMTDRLANHLEKK